MADEAYVLNSDGVRNTRVVIRFDVPSSNNAVGVPWIQTVSEWYNQRKKIDPEIDTQWPGRTDADLTAGVSVEIVQTFTHHIDSPGIEAALVAWAIAQVTEEKTKLSKQLNYWGKVIP